MVNRTTWQLEAGLAERVQKRINDESDARHSLAFKQVLNRDIDFLKELIDGASPPLIVLGRLKIIRNHYLNARRTVDLEVCADSGNSKGVERA